MQPTLRHVRLPGGLTIECAEQGRRGGPCAAAAARHHRHLAFLRAGAALAAAGLARGLDDAARPRRLVRRHELPHARLRGRCRRLVATLGLPPVLVVGHSMGAVNAMRMAIDHPAAVRGVVAAGGFASFSDKPGLVDFIRDQVLTLGEQVPRELAESFQRDTVAGPVAPGLLETMVDECLRTPAATWRGAFAALLEDDFRTEVHKIEVPVLLPWGDADAFSPESDQQRLQRQLRRATRAVYAGVGHALHWELPRRFADDLIRFEQTLAMPEMSQPGARWRQHRQPGRPASPMVRKSGPRHPSLQDEREHEADDRERCRHDHSGTREHHAVEHRHARDQRHDGTRHIAPGAATKQVQGERQHAHVQRQRQPGHRRRQRERDAVEHRHGEEAERPQAAMRSRCSCFAM